MADVSHTRGDVSHTRGDMTSHPDVSEMRERYARMLGGRDVALMDGPLFLLGLYCAASPWIVHYTTGQPALAVHNLIIGIAIGLLALGFTRAPERMYGLSWAMSALGVWMIIAPWIVGSHPNAGVIANNVVIGGLAVALGLLCAGASAKAAKTSTPKLQDRPRTL
ncbi:SPW repeat protein [Streptomyces sp. NPDC006012]|uniref:SPW repeat protein n=1 Tax=Streptomyces sp. NPDC006012 TaxID=3364739 RepID=UPI0036B07E97